MSLISKSDRKVKEVKSGINKLVEIFRFQSTFESEVISYNYLYDNQKYFIHEDDNMIIKISEEIQWGNKDSEHKSNTESFERNSCGFINKDIYSHSFSHDNKLNQIRVRYFEFFDDDECSNKKCYYQPSDQVDINETMNLIYTNDNLYQKEPNSKEQNFLIRSQSSLKKIKPFKDFKFDKLLSKKPDPNIFLQEIIYFNSFMSKVIQVTVKCKFCKNSDHLSRNCPNFTDHTNDVCILCIGPVHKLAECPIRKCLKCNRTGHSVKTCNAEKNIEKCTECKNIGHLSEDCLLHPFPIKKEIIEANICSFCNQKGHFLCPSKKEFLINDYSEDIYISSEDSDRTESASEIKNSKIEEDINGKDEISIYKLSRIFCPKCAGEHNLEECDINSSKIYNTNDDLRKKFSKSFFAMAPSKLANDKNFVGDDSNLSSEDERDSDH